MARRDEQVSKLQKYSESEISAREIKLDRKLGSEKCREFYRPYGVRPGPSLFDGITFDCTAQVFRDPCHLWQGGLLKVYRFCNYFSEGICCNNIEAVKGSEEGHVSNVLSLTSSLVLLRESRGSHGPEERRIYSPWYTTTSNQRLNMLVDKH